MGEDGRAEGGGDPAAKPRGTVAMREEAGLERERMREDERGGTRMREEGRGWDGSELAEMEGVGGCGEDEG